MKKLEKDSEVNYREYFVDNRFALSEEMFKGRAMIDIGANIGIFALLAWGHGSSPVLAVESNLANFNLLKENVKKTVTIIPVHYAAFNGICQEALVVENGGISKISPKLGEGEKVPCKSLAELMDMVWCPSDSILKIDIEGAEYDVLLSAAGKDIRRFKTIYLETHKVASTKTEKCGESPLLPCKARTADYLLDYMDFLGYEVAKKDSYCWFEWLDGKPTGYHELEDQKSYRLERRD
jgi:FkbM family methyltransferase